MQVCDGFSELPPVPFSRLLAVSMEAEDGVSGVRGPPEGTDSTRMQEANREPGIGCVALCLSPWLLAVSVERRTGFPF